jgi:hypothetical protein
MSTYVLRQVDEALWRRFKSRAAAEGLPLKYLMLQLIEAYADRKIDVAVKAERMTPCQD